MFLAKAELSLARAESEFANGRYDNCANRAYYACFQAAIAALLHAGIAPTTRSGRWRHDFVQAAFSGELVNGGRLYPTFLRSVLGQNAAARHTADYGNESVSEFEAGRAWLQARRFLETVGPQGD